MKTLVDYVSRIYFIERYLNLALGTSSPPPPSPYRFYQFRKNAEHVNNYLYERRMDITRIQSAFWKSIHSNVRQTIFSDVSTNPNLNVRSKIF